MFENDGGFCNLSSPISPRARKGHYLAQEDGFLLRTELTSAEQEARSVVPMLLRKTSHFLSVSIRLLIICPCLLHILPLSSWFTVIQPTGSLILPETHQSLP